MKFRDFLQEQKEKHAVMAFGRMNPITSGHEKLVQTVQDIAKRVGGTAHIVVSHSQDPKKNPLSAAQKIKHAKRAFPGVNITASDSSAPNFLAQAAKLHKQGVTHFHMVGGADRVEEFHNLLHKYNGVKGPHGSFNFKHIEVHSAGDRDPDAEGVEGMSASKMREHANKNNYKEFRKGVPSTMSDAHAKQMFNDVRKGMNVKEDINEDFQSFLIEGVHDKSIFKAVFLAGGPGSGKDYVLDNTLQGHGLTEINSDKALEFLMDKEGLDKRMPTSEQDKRNLVRGRAKNMTELRQRLALVGRNGLIINGTGDDAEKIKRIKERLEEIGYDTSMIMVNTADEVSKQRNIERGQRGGRTVPEEVRKQKWDSVQASRPELAKMFGQKYMEFDNSEDLRQASPEVVKAKKEELTQLFKNVQQFVADPPKSEVAQGWVARELEQKDTLPIPENGAEMTPHAPARPRRRTALRAPRAIHARRARRRESRAARALHRGHGDRDAARDRPHRRRRRGGAPAARVAPPRLRRSARRRHARDRRDAHRARRRASQARHARRRPRRRPRRAPQDRPQELRDRDWRRRRARCRRLRRRDRPPRSAPRAASDHGARAGRCRDGRQERRQPLRQEELRRRVRGSVRRPVRRVAAGEPADRRLPRGFQRGRQDRTAARPRAVYRARGTLRVDRSGRHRCVEPHHPPQRAAPSRAHRRRRRSVRDARGAAARLRPLGRAPA